MSVVAYSNESTMRQARAQYFEANHFGENGGYDDAWVDFKFGPVPFPIPNTPGRVRAVGYHDLHHVLTGIDTDTIGELEIAGYEVGAGCGRYWMGWQINLGAFALGALVSPRRVFRAFVRGRNAKSLYAREYEGRLEDLLDRTVASMRAETKLDRDPPAAKISDYAAYGAFFALGVVTGIPFTAAFVPLMPLGFVMLQLKKRQEAAQAA